MLEEGRGRSSVKKLEEHVPSTKLCAKPKTDIPNTSLETLPSLP